MTVAIYSEEVGGLPLWEETQTIPIGGGGQFDIILGQTQSQGIPLEVFASGDARWLGMVWARPGEVEGPRTRLTSVPYALRASDADTLGGRPASAFLLAPTAPDGSVRTVTTVNTIGSPQTASANVLLPGTPDFLAKYVNSTDVSNSAVFENGGLVGIGTTTPLDMLHVQFTNTAGTLTGLAVQNLGNTGAAYSGMLFYDQNGALGQFQGFGNLTHEYRINNIAKSGMNYNGTINFMIGSTSRLFVNSNGVGIGTTSPTATLHVVGNTTKDALDATNSTGFHAIRADGGSSGSGALVGILGNPGGDIAASAAIIGWGNGGPAGVIGYTDSGNAIEGISTTGFAGYFSGNVTVTGTLSKGGGSFKIDHPLDPANKYLLHSFVESPDMMNIYNGNVTLDAHGEAIVTLPDWFEALNRDFRYQLTALGAPGPNLYIAEEIANGRFKIGGGAGGGRVSWMVTGIRHDAFAEAHRIAIEEEKPATERGHYLYPELYGQPADTRIGPATTVKRKDQ